MIRRLIPSLAILFLAYVAHAQSILSLNPSFAPVGSTCPYGSSYADGCSGAPAGGQFVNATAFSASGSPGNLRQSGQSYGSTGACTHTNCHPPWNVAGIDFAVGNYTTKASLCDPNGGCSLDSHCTWSATANGGNPRLTCTNGVVSVTGINFGPIGSHGSTQLVFANSVAGNISVINNYFEGDAGLCGYLAYPGYNAMMIYAIQPNSTANFDIESNWAEAKAGFGHACNNLTASPLISETFANINTIGNFILKYNVINGGFPNNPVYYYAPSGSGQTVTVQYNYSDTGYSGRDMNHGEWDIIHMVSGSSMGAQTFTFNTLFEGFDSFADTTTMIWMGQGVTGQTYASFEVGNNVMVANYVRNLTGQPGSCVTYTVDDGADNGVNNGNIMTIDTNTCSPGLVVGESMSYFGLVQDLGPNPAVGNKEQWLFDCLASTPLQGDSHQCTGVTLAQDITGPKTIHLVQASAITPQVVTASHMITAPGPTYTTGPYIHDNYMDGTGANSSFIYNTSSTCGTAATISGNVNMVTGAVISSWTNTPSGGC